VRLISIEGQYSTELHGGLAILAACENSYRRCRLQAYKEDRRPWPRNSPQWQALDTIDAWNDRSERFDRTKDAATILAKATYPQELQH
jgi:hypothetical protein